MALRAFTVSITRPPTLSESADAVDSALSAVTDAIEAALEVEDIAESEDGAAAVTAIGTALTGVETALSADVTLLINEQNVGSSTYSPTREDILAALDQLRAQILSSDMYTEAWYRANEEEE
jgi:hypothetical protein